MLNVANVSVVACAARTLRALSSDARARKEMKVRKVLRDLMEVPCDLCHRA